MLEAAHALRWCAVSQTLGNIRNLCCTHASCLKLLQYSDTCRGCISSTAFCLRRPLDPAFVPCQEMEAAATTLAVDAKNYHAWAHRQALVAAWDLWDEELAFAEAVLADDVRNNSAWNQRFFILTRGGTQQPADVDGSRVDRVGALPLLPAVLDNELSYVAAALHRAPDNASAWAYLRGLLTLPAGVEVLVHDERVPDLCFSALQRLPSCSMAMDMLSEVYCARAAAALQHDDLTTAALAKQHADTIHAALRINDPLRDPYWSFVVTAMSLHTPKHE